MNSLAPIALLFSGWLGERQCRRGHHDGQPMHFDRENARTMFVCVRDGCTATGWGELLQPPAGWRA